MGREFGGEVVGLGLTFEDMPVGRKIRTIGRSITETDIVNFISCTGILEVMFTDLEFQKSRTDIKGRVAPGMLVFNLAEGLLVQATMQHTGLAFLHMEYNVEKPVFVGDTIHVEAEVIEARRSKSKPDRGLVRCRNHIVNQRGEVVQTYTPLRMVAGRDMRHA
jgi:acyl dehydratase